MKKALFILPVFLHFLLTGIRAQDFPDIKFSLLNTTGGLPTHLITSVFKDSRGLVWMGTENNGLVRYDGIKIKTYHDDRSIASQYTGTICEDKKGWLWISSAMGLYHFDPVTEETVLYRHDDRDKNSVGSNDKPQPFIDTRGRLWITSSNGLQLFDATRNKFTAYTLPPVTNPAWQKEFNHLGPVLEDSRRRIWVGSAYGLYLVDTVQHTLSPYYTGAYQYVTGLYEGANQRIWVSFWGGGVKEFDPASGKFTDRFLNGSIVTGVTGWEDGNKKKWICFTWNNTLMLLDPVNFTSRSYAENTNNPGSISGKDAGYLYCDPDNRLWISTSEGLNIVDNHLQHFNNRLLYAGTDQDNSKLVGVPKDMLELKDMYLLSSWAGMNSLYEYDKRWNLLRIIRTIPPGSPSVLSSNINTIQQDKEGNTWYGTDSGLVKQTGKQFRCYLPGDHYPGIEGRYKACNIIKRSDGLYWVRYSRRGIYLFNPVTGRYEKNYRDQYSGDALTMEEDKNGQVWLGTRQGLFYYNTKLDSFIRVPVISNNKPTEGDYNCINRIYFDETNTGWIATTNGLLKLYLPGNTIEFITDPLRPGPYQAIRVLKDSAGVIWIESFDEIIAYNSVKKQFRYFTPDNGLPRNFLGQYGIFKLLTNNTIAVGSLNTLTTFNPYILLKDSINALPIQFIDISIDDKRVTTPSTKSIIAPPGAKNIRIHFALLNYTAPLQNKLFYRISEKNNNEWTESPDGDISLYSLPPGKYVVQVKGINSGTAVETTDQLTVTISPYWYQTAAFRVIGLLLIVLAVYLFIAWRLRSVRKAARIRQEITAMEMAALKAQMNPHFMFNCINSIDAFIQDNDKYNATLYLNKFARLIRNVLDSSRQNTVTFPKDMETLKLYIELEQLRSENKFISVLVIDPELLNSDYKVPPLIVQPFVENAIVHGLRNKETNDGRLSVHISKTEEYILYKISDNGIGRKAVALLSTGQRESYGLQMSYERVRLFNGETVASVQVTDLYHGKEAAGTEVHIQLKIV